MTSRRSRTVIALALAVLALGAVRAELPTPQTLEQEAERAWNEDVERWSHYVFERHVTRRSFDAEGSTKFQQEMRFRVTPTGDGFDEELIEIDGRTPKSGEVDEHRRKAIFTKHYRQASTLNLENPIGENLALLPIIVEQDHQLVGEDQVNGVPCYRTSFAARPDPEKGSVRERLKYAIEGSACFAVEGYHVVSFEMTTVRSLKKGAFRMNHLHMTIEGQPVNGGWVPRVVALRSDAVAFGKRLRKANTWRYTDFRLRSDGRP